MLEIKKIKDYMKENEKFRNNVEDLLVNINFTDSFCMSKKNIKYWKLVGRTKKLLGYKGYIGFDCIEDKEEDEEENNNQNEEQAPASGCTIF